LLIVYNWSVMNKVNYMPISKNRRARYDYEISRTLVAGIVLNGPEVKSIRNGSVSLKGSFANFKDGELWLNNMHVSKYAHSSPEDNQDPERPRKLLLNKVELARLVASKQNGNHITILSVGVSGKYIKAELGIGRSKKIHDKRQKIKSRNQLRDAQKAQARLHKK